MLLFVFSVLYLFIIYFTVPTIPPPPTKTPRTERPIDQGELTQLYDWADRVMIGR